ncbi:MAG: cobalt ECF transporter T component CbiQ [Actinobacteria bacterium]|nr:cobalt ECF transporter T component CbiQ [Actinomycetota bacterium]
MTEQRNNIYSDIPAWLLEKNLYNDMEASASKTHFIRKTLKHISEVFENELFCEKFAGKPLFLQSIDPRVKLLTLIFYMVLSSFTSNIVVLLILAVIPLLYAKLSGLELKDYIRRSWLYIPVLVLVFSIPGVTSLFVKGSPLVTVLRPGVMGLQSGLYFSMNGIEVALRIALRAGISLSFGFLLLLTTRWSKITSALALMHVPLLFISVLNMAYRYIFVISAMACDMMEARYLRTVGKLDTSDNRRFMGHSVAHMFIKSHYLSEEIYDAMRCRGFTGRPVSCDKFKVKGTDIFFIINNVIIVLILIAGEHLF